MRNKEDQRNEKEESDSGRRETKRKKAVCVWGSVLLFSKKLGLID